MTVLFFVTGSIAAFKACEVISQLRKQGVEVLPVATAGALQFVGKATLEGLTGQRVFSDTFEEGHMMDHIHWAKRADMAIVCPASAEFLCGLAQGTAGGAAGALALAFDVREKPFFVAPAMNTVMWKSPAVERALSLLKQDGFRIIAPEEGSLACGDYGAGRLAEPAYILSVIAPEAEERQ